MRLMHASFALSALLAGFTGADALLDRPAPRARLITVEVLVAGELLLRGTASDDGTPDADAVWAYLRNVALTPTEAFGKLGVAADAKAHTLFGTPIPPRGGRGELRHERDVVVAISYGGVVETFDVVLQRTKDRNGDDAWRLHPKELEDHFWLRRITRRQAAELERPAGR